MKPITFLALLFFSLPTILFSEDFNCSYGKVGKSDMDMTDYPKDKSAEAVVISDVGSSFFEQTNDNFDLIYERTTRLKVFKEAGIKWASIEIPYYRQGDIYEEVYDIEASTYNLTDGMFTRTNLDLNSCHEEKLNEYWNLKKFAMPNVKAGSVIEYHYKVRSQFLFNLRPGDARLAAIGAFGAFDDPGILDVFDGTAHLTQQGFGLNQLFVELRPVARRLGCQSGITHKYLFCRRHHTPPCKRLPTQRARGNCRRAGGICF